ncbi:hypothetical protein GCM10008022_29880 [Paenibacillus hunanensis]|uniref:Cysteine-rich CPCC domain-containing protein n=1 Tax=Paenibacillus hunanensis TaxID=539262 RepID=A0ABU1IY65_9BACL|nr:hypothetical protein [Paenibacillus hunanensis]GGJ18678.1 hypothetical protein GCM10008022_29880 [Paenibacillus hunanensis]
MYVCPCCGYRTLDEEPPGSFFICAICYWEDDYLQYYDVDFEGGANHFSLRQAQSSFKKHQYKLINEIATYEYVGARDITNIRRVPMIEMYTLFKAMDAPLNKLLDLYSGFLISKEDSELVYSYEDIVNVYINSDDWHRYIYLKEGEKGIGNPLDLKQELQQIEKQFIEKLEEKHTGI